MPSIPERRAIALGAAVAAFADRGGKFLMYHGWADSLIPASLSLDFWGSGSIDDAANFTCTTP